MKFDESKVVTKRREEKRIGLIINSPDFPSRNLVLIVESHKFKLKVDSKLNKTKGL